MATLFALITIIRLVSYDIEVRSMVHAVFDAVLLSIIYAGMLNRTRRLIELEASSTRDEVLTELRRTVRVVLPIAAFIPAMVLAQRLVFGR